MSDLIFGLTSNTMTSIFTWLDRWTGLNCSYPDHSLPMIGDSRSNRSPDWQGKVNWVWPKFRWRTQFISPRRSAPRFGRESPLMDPWGVVMGPAHPRSFVWPSENVLIKFTARSNPQVLWIQVGNVGFEHDDTTLTELAYCWACVLQAIEVSVCACLRWDETLGIFVLTQFQSLPIILTHSILEYEQPSRIKSTKESWIVNGYPMITKNCLWNKRCTMFPFLPSFSLNFLVLHHVYDVTLSAFRFFTKIYEYK